MPPQETEKIILALLNGYEVFSHYAYTTALFNQTKAKTRKYFYLFFKVTSEYSHKSVLWAKEESEVILLSS